MIDTLLLLAALLGLVAGGVLVARSPAFWFGLGLVAFNAAKPQFVKIWLKLSARMSPEKEKAFQQAMRRGQAWDNFRKRPRDPK